jgi:hypothetical protein
MTMPSPAFTSDKQLTDRGHLAPVSTMPDRLPDGGDDRNALPSRRAGPHSGGVRLCGAAAAGPAREAARFGFHGEVAALVRGRPKPKVYFEEWDDPLISGIGWVSELIEIAGGEDVFPELRKQKAAKDRIVSPHDVIMAARPTSFSPLGAARRSFRTRSGNDPAGMRSQRYGTTASSRSNRR